MLKNRNWWVLTFALCLPALAQARPEFLMRFAADPFSRPERRATCDTCHVSPAGGGPRNPFGRAFAAAGFRVTPELRAKWPDRFLQVITTQEPAPLPKATWSAARPEEVLVEIGGEQYLLNRAEASVRKVEPAQAQAFTALPPGAAAPAAEEPAEVLPPRATFDYYLVNLPTTRARDPRSLHLHFTHRFSDPLIEGTGRLGDLFGLDSFSTSSFGVELGLTRHLGFMTYRTPYPRSVGGPTIELGPVFNVVQQGGAAPVSFAFRSTIEGQQNFTERFTLNLMPVVSRSFADRVEVFVAPTLHAWVPRRSLTGDFPFTPGETRDHMGSIGVGASVRIRPRVAIVGEWRPRVAGFRGYNTRNPYAFAIQRATNRHVFALTFSNSVSSTTTRGVTDGLDDFRIGFNLYRRLW